MSSGWIGRLLGVVAFVSAPVVAWGGVTEIGPLQPYAAPIVGASVMGLAFDGHGGAVVLDRWGWNMSRVSLADASVLSVATVGFYGKLLAEDIEDMDASQAEAVRATGSSWLQWINYGVQPQVMPRMIGLGLYRFDINFRESAVVGIVGGGGIGATLNTAFDRYEFDSAAAILIVIIMIVMACEYGSGYLRRWVQ